MPTNAPDTEARLTSRHPIPVSEIDFAETLEAKPLAPKPLNAPSEALARLELLSEQRITRRPDEKLAVVITDSDAPRAPDIGGCRPGIDPDTKAHGANLSADPVTIVNSFMCRREISVLFNGRFERKNAPRMATNYDEIETYLSDENVDLDAQWILDELLLEVKSEGIDLTKVDAERALRKIVRKGQRERRKKIIRSLLEPVDVLDRERAKAEWERQATLFDAEATLTVAILQHFIWQVKQKALGRPVFNHLMPIVYSKAQGTGKTTFAKMFLSPLEDLATDPIPLEHFADVRNAEIYRYLAVFVDDVGGISKKMVATLKSVITSDALRRRILSTSSTTQIRQNATLFGTANNHIGELVADKTGHRRFAMLPFRNLDEQKGGNPSLWQTVDSLDYKLLWRSINAFAESPLKPHLPDLAQHQGSCMPDPFRDWLTGIDVNSDAFRNIRKHAGLPAKALYDLFCMQTRENLTESLFGRKMPEYFADPATPFGSKNRTREGIFYQLK